ncbi:hypothetical protein DY000_02015198 [Brassica cretica]|uniref:Uncharacterized protein n=1 Tax=Brassica cretica TaxID=69181 RepID=A0ABQ7CM50_BRACR|nr:hypothetical protein DY000_02015198 [Brassica cretica]
MKWVRYGLRETALKGRRECMDSCRIDVSEELGRYVATERDRHARILAKRQILGSRIRVFDTMPRDVRDQCAEFWARPRFTPGFRGCDD